MAHSILISAFADESAVSKQANEQLAVMSALGLRYYSVRFVDLGNGVKNVMKLDVAELAELVTLNQRYGLSVASIGSPIGKVKLIDRPDGTNNAYIPFATYLERDVNHAIELAHTFGTKLIRGFSFYPPKGDSPDQYLSQGIDQIGQIAERCRRAAVVYGLELEANLLGSTGRVLAQIASAINNPSMVLIFDGGNLACQNVSAEETLAEYQAMRPWLGWMHVKDYKIDRSLVWHGHVDEDRLKNFVPVGNGDAGYDLVFTDLKNTLAEIDARMRSLGAPGTFIELEPHVRGGGQFGGYSGPDGMGISLRALTKLLDQTGLEYQLRSATDLD